MTARSFNVIFNWLSINCGNLCDWVNCVNSLVYRCCMCIGSVKITLGTLLQTVSVIVWQLIQSGVVTHSLGRKLSVWLTQWCVVLHRVVGGLVLALEASL